MSETALQRAEAIWRNGRRRGRDDGGLPPSGPGGTSDDMEARVKRLEDDYKELRSDLKTLLVDVAVLKERVSHLPTKGWAVGWIIALVAFMGTFATLAPKLQVFFGVVKP